MFDSCTGSQISLGLFFVAAGVMHFVKPRFYVVMMPKPIPLGWRRPLVWISGVCEIAGGVGVLIPSVRSIAGLGLLALLVAVFPANVQMLLNARAARASRVMLLTLWVRLPLQLVLLAWVWYAVPVRIGSSVTIRAEARASTSEHARAARCPDIPADEAILMMWQGDDCLPTADLLTG